MIKIDAYEETLREQAEYFDMPVADVRKIFERFLALNYRDAKELLTPFQRALCIGIYRIVKLKGACRMAMNSRELWKERAGD